jgi:class IV lanthipeptide synthase
LEASHFSFNKIGRGNPLISTPEGVLRMLDAEGLARIVSHRPFRLITPGYCSPEQECGDVSGVLDDVYALGALLRFALTGCDLRSYLDAKAAMRLSLRHWNAFVNTEIDYVVRRCLNVEPQKRFRSMSELRDVLVRIDPGSDRAHRCGGRNDEIGASLEASVSAFERTQRADEFARSLADTLVEKSQLMAPQDRRTWVTRAVPGLDVPIRDLGLGAAGVVLVLSALVEAFGRDAHRAALRQGADWLAEAKRPEGPGAAGLFAGEAGVGAALLRAGQALSHQPLIEVAEKYSRSVSEMPHISPDLYSGSAGRLRFHIMVWEHTRKDEHLSYAVGAGQALLVGMRNCGAGWAWPIPRECGSLSQSVWPSFSRSCCSQP